MEYILWTFLHQICLWTQMHEGSPDANVQAVDLFN